MNKLMDWANTDDSIRVDIDALWTKAQSDDSSIGVAVKSAKTSDYASAMDDMGEFAIISAWARGKGKKG